METPFPREELQSLPIAPLQYLTLFSDASFQRKKISDSAVKQLVFTLDVPLFPVIHRRNT